MPGQVHKVYLLYISMVLWSQPVSGATQAKAPIDAIDLACLQLEDVLKLQRAWWKMWRSLDEHGSFTKSGGVGLQKWLPTKNKHVAEM